MRWCCAFEKFWRKVFSTLLSITIAILPFGGSQVCRIITKLWRLKVRQMPLLLNKCSHSLSILAFLRPFAQKFRWRCLATGVWGGVNLSYNLFLILRNSPEVSWNFQGWAILANEVAIKLWLLILFYKACPHKGILVVICSFIVIKRRTEGVWVQKSVSSCLWCLSERVCGLYMSGVWFEVTHRNYAGVIVLFERRFDLVCDLIVEVLVSTTPNAWLSCSGSSVVLLVLLVFLQLVLGGRRLDGVILGD